MHYQNDPLNALLENALSKRSSKRIIGDFISERIPEPTQIYVKLTSRTWKDAKHIFETLLK
jgi:hypothetical protein